MNLQQARASHALAISQVQKSCPGLDLPEAQAVAFFLLVGMDQREVQCLTGIPPQKLRKLVSYYDRASISSPAAGGSRGAHLRPAPAAKRLHTPRIPKKPLGSL